MEDWPKEFTVGERCYETYPCKHWMRVDGKSYLRGAVKIVAALQRSGQAVPDHFQYVLRDPFQAARVQKLIDDSRQS